LERLEQAYAAAEENCRVLQEWVDTLQIDLASAEQRVQETLQELQDMQATNIEVSKL
jgi:hypothetical protein